MGKKGDALLKISTFEVVHWGLALFLAYIGTFCPFGFISNPPPPLTVPGSQKDKNNMHKINIIM
jgi:hypothetical protein